MLYYNSNRTRFDVAMSLIDRRPFVELSRPEIAVKTLVIVEGLLKHGFKGIRTPIEWFNTPELRAKRRHLLYEVERIVSADQEARRCV
jgi:hypothetical protein